MDESSKKTFRKYKISLREINTGESKVIEMQINQEFNIVEALVHHAFDSDEFTVTNIELVPSIISIALEPFCLN